MVILFQFKTYLIFCIPNPIEKPSRHYYGFDEMEGLRIKHPTTVIDTVGNPKLVPGKIGQALRLNGNQQKADFDNGDDCLSNIDYCRHGILMSLWFRYVLLNCCILVEISISFIFISISWWNIYFMFFSIFCFLVEYPLPVFLVEYKCIYFFYLYLLVEYLFLLFLFFVFWWSMYYLYFFFFLVDFFYFLSNHINILLWCDLNWYTFCLNKVCRIHNVCIYFKTYGHRWRQLYGRETSSCSYVA